MTTDDNVELPVQFQINLCYDLSTEPCIVADIMSDTIIYEQPLNEIIRVCLRMEQLFQQLDHQLHDSSELGTRNVITFIINLLHLLDRPDLKAKLAKEMNHHLSNLMRYGD